jgi:hypothetical protein
LIIQLLLPFNPQAVWVLLVGWGLVEASRVHDKWLSSHKDTCRLFCKELEQFKRVHWTAFVSEYSVVQVYYWVGENGLKLSLTLP